MLRRKTEKSNNAVSQKKNEIWMRNERPKQPKKNERVKRGKRPLVKWKPNEMPNDNEPRPNPKHAPNESVVPVPKPKLNNVVPTNSAATRIDAARKTTDDDRKNSGRNVAVRKNEHALVVERRTRNDRSIIQNATTSLARGRSRSTSDQRRDQRQLPLKAYT